MKRILILLANLLTASAIYDGNEATKHQFPYVVFVSSPQFYCAGAIISDRHVITAAHCLMSIREGQKVKVILGMHNNNWNRDGVTVWSSKFWIHEKFTMPTAEYDIGLIELPQTINELTNNNSRIAKPIKIDATPNIDLDPSEKEIIVSSWGHTSRHNPATVLKFTKMKLISINECMQYQSHYIESINRDHICTEKTQGMVCDGDSGSVIVSMKTNKVVGVLSYVKDAENFTDMGYNDCKSKVPAVSTRISSYIGWISAKSGIDFSKPDKVCVGLGVVNSTNIINYSGCETIQGNLEINNRTFMGMHPDKLKVFGNVRKITGYLKVTAYHPEFTDLRYFKNLEEIGTEQIGNFPIVLFIYKSSLKSFGLISLRSIEKGSIFIAKNNDLCYVDKIAWKKLRSVTSRVLVLNLNKNQAQCEIDGEVCSNKCLPSGCWGKDEYECLEIANNVEESNEVEEEY